MFDVIKSFFESGAVQFILGSIILLAGIGIILFLIFVEMYHVAKTIADERADMKVERIRRQLEEEFDEYKKNIRVDTDVDINLYRGVGYAKHRSKRIKRIS